MRRRLLTSTLLVTLALSSSSASAAAPTPFCSQFSDLAESGEVGSVEIDELSGLAASRAHPGVLWAHNDSGDTARVFALDEAGALIGTFDVARADAVDWEDIAVGPGVAPGSSALYIADMGDNLAARTDGVTIYRVPEPPERPDADGRLRGTQVLRLVYPGGPEDAEALLIDPLDGSLLIVTKSIIGQSRLLGVTADQLVPGAPITLTDLGTITIPVRDGAPGLPGTMVTAGDVSPDGAIVALRTYQAVYTYDRAEGASLADALQTEACLAPSAVENQGESLAFTADGSAYLTASEVQGAIERGELPPGTFATISRVNIDPPAAPPTTTTTTTTTTTVAPTTVAPTTVAPTTVAPATSPPTAAPDPSQVDGPATTVADSASNAIGAGGIVAVALLATVLVVGGIVLVRRRSTPR